LLDVVAGQRWRVRHHRATLEAHWRPWV
jgi:hypothetical protein